MDQTVNFSNERFALMGATIYVNPSDEPIRDDVPERSSIIRPSDIRPLCE